MLRLAAALFVWAAGPALAQTPWTVSVRSLGPVRFGMTLSEAQEAAGGRLRVGDCNGTCCAVSVAGRDDVGFLVEDGVVQRGEVYAAGVATRSGVGVGDAEAVVRRTYPGQIRQEPHTYVEGGHYLVFTPRDPEGRPYGVVFETDGARVTMIRAGRWPAVGYVEGCY